MKDVIITACDAKCGNFVVESYLESLLDNIDTDKVEIVVLDYGLTATQVKAMKYSGVTVIKCKKDGHVVNIRFRDAANFLKGKNYRQVLATDSGDIIFQADISELFETDQDHIRIAQEHIQISFNDLMISGLKKEFQSDAATLLKNRKSLNAGVLIGPADKMIDLFERAFSMIEKVDAFGSDQVAINYILYNDGFQPLDSKFNFMLSSTDKEYFVNDGVFYLSDGSVIPIVHNAGRVSCFRPIDKFGYGPRCNEVKHLSLAIIRALLRHKKVAEIESD